MAQNRRIYLILTVVALMAVVVPLAATRPARYNKSVDVDVTEMQKGLDQPRSAEHSHIYSIDQLPMPDDLRVRATERGYTFRLRQDSKYEICAKYFKSWTESSPSETRCVVK